jgi:hypothetical protein
MIAWPLFNGKPIGTVLRSSSWDEPLGIIGDQTRSGKLKVRAAHIKEPVGFNLTMHMTLDQYREFINWYRNTCRRGLYSFAYPKINDNTGILIEYRFVPDTKIGVKNTSALNLELTMNWIEV